MDLKPTPGGPEGFPFSEKKVRAALGVSRDEVRALRTSRLTEGVHFARGKQMSVWLNQSGVDALMPPAAQSSAQPPETRSGPNADDSGAKKPAPGETPKDPNTQTPKPEAEVVTLRVVHCSLKNPHLLLACADKEDPDRPEKTVRVRVRSTANFTRRMEIPATLVAGYSDLYDLACRCPRQKGKW